MSVKKRQIYSCFFKPIFGTRQFRKDVPREQMTIIQDVLTHLQVNEKLFYYLAFQ